MSTRCCGCVALSLSPTSVSLPLPLTPLPLSPSPLSLSSPRAPFFPLLTTLLQVFRPLSFSPSRNPLFPLLAARPLFPSHARDSLYDMASYTGLRCLALSFPLCRAPPFPLVATCPLSPSQALDLLLAIANYSTPGVSPSLSFSPLHCKPPFSFASYLYPPSAGPALFHF